MNENILLGIALIVLSTICIGSLVIG
ncbi:uncharacterized protein METZ01_LOCUS99767 [marine metagenome]|uniref:Uncharacterized protein n=1 Tax=marine metagenome TaxID=408172 RepID=A0A381W4T0_9ZZZZ